MGACATESGWNWFSIPPSLNGRYMVFEIICRANGLINVRQNAVGGSSAEEFARSLDARWEWLNLPARRIGIFRPSDCKNVEANAGRNKIIVFSHCAVGRSSSAV